MNCIKCGKDDEFIDARESMMLELGRMEGEHNAPAILGRLERLIDAKIAIALSEIQPRPMVRSTLKTVAASAKRRDDWLVYVFRQIQEAAYDGQNGSPANASDRLALIQSIAATMLHRLEK